MHHNRRIHAEAAVHLEPKEGEWENIKGLVDWLVALHAKYKYNTMAMLAYFAASQQSIHSNCNNFFYKPK
jgi:hypothetical protein